jgi:hypothetical protein
LYYFLNFLDVGSAPYRTTAVSPGLQFVKKNH